MRRNIQVRAIENRDPDIRLYVLALIALARQLQEEADVERGREVKVWTNEEGRDA